MRQCWQRRGQYDNQPHYLEHIRQATTDAICFVEGLSKEAFLEDRRTQQAVVMSLIIIGEASTKIMDQFRISLPVMRKSLGAACVVCATGSPMVTLISTST
ncbi:HepT-like ribonuclease domain-containing protein [Pseudomonas fluorescens]|uniref:HepT-like ribonuclease domain-containing protein n=1 Tax=Pseudomonas fluorescens TaxID=294 RepID=UPI003F7435BA